MAMYIVLAVNITTMAMQLKAVVIVVNHDYTVGNNCLQLVAVVIVVSHDYAVGYNCYYGLHNDHVLMVTDY